MKKKSVNKSSTIKKLKKKVASIVARRKKASEVPPITHVAKEVTAPKIKKPKAVPEHVEAPKHVHELEVVAQDPAPNLVATPKPVSESVEAPAPVTKVADPVAEVEETQGSLSDPVSVPKLMPVTVVRSPEESTGEKVSDDEDIIITSFKT